MANYSISYDINADTSGFKQSLNELSSKMKNFFSSLKGGISDFTSGLGNVSSNFKTFSKDGSAAFKELGNGITDTAEMLSPSGVLGSGIADTIVLLQKLGDEFDNLRARMVQLTGTEGINELEDNLKNVLGEGVPQSARTVAETLAVVHKSFDLVGDSLEIMTKKFTDFAHVTGADIPNTVEKVSEAIKKWGLSTEDASVILERLTYATQHSNASVKDLLTGLTNGQAVLSQFGMSVSESIAFLAKLSDNGIKVNTTVWGMRNALAEFSKSGINAAEGLETVTEQIQNAKTQTEALNISVDTFGTKAGPELVQVLKKGNDEIASFTNELINANDVIRKDEEEMETLTVMVEKLVNSIKATFSSLGQSVNDVAKLLVESLKGLVNILSILKPLFDGLNFAIKFLITPVKILVEGFNLLVESIRDFTDAEREAKKAVEESIIVYEKEQQLLDNLRVTVKDMSKETLQSKVEITKNRLSYWENVKNELQEQIKSEKELISEYNDLMGFDDEGNVVDFTARIQPGTEEFARLSDSFDKSKDSLAELEKSLENADLAVASLSAELAVYQEELAANTESEIKSVTEFVSSLGKVTENWREKLLRQQVAMLQEEQKNAVTRLQNEGASDEKIFAEREKYNDKIKEANLELINYLEEQSEKEFITKVANAHKVSYEEAALLAKDKKNHKEYYDVLSQIDDYYNNERKRNEEGTIERIKSLEESVIPVASEYQKKLLQQNIDTSKKLMQNALTRAENENATEETIAKIKEKYGNHIIHFTEMQYEIARKEALQGITDTEEIARINMYWDNEVANLKLENIEKIIQANEEMNKVDNSWAIRILQLDKEQATRDKEKIRIQKEIYELQKEQDLARADEADKAKIIEYYDRLILGLTEDIAKAGEKHAEGIEIDYTWTKKLMEQDEKWLKLSMDIAEREAEVSGKSEFEIFKMKERHLKDIKDKQLELLALEEEKDKERYKGTAQALDVEKWYQNERYLLEVETQNKINALKPVKSGGFSAADEVNAREKAMSQIYEMEQSWEEKTFNQKIANFEYLKEVNLDIAKENGWTQEQIYENQAEYIDKITEMKKKALNKEKEDALLNAKEIMENALQTEGLTKEEKEKITDDYAKSELKINEYYLAEENKLILESVRERESFRSEELKNNEALWKKILGFATNTLTSIDNGLKEVLGNNEAVRQFSDVFQGMKDVVADTFSIFVDSIKDTFTALFPELSQQVKSFFTSIDDKAKKLIEELPSWAKDILEVVKNAGGKLISVVGNLGKMIISTFKGMIAVFDLYKNAWNGFTKLIEFDPDEAIIGLLELEDKILSFFMFTLPQLPSYFLGAVQSVAVLFDTLFDTIDFDGLFDTLADVVMDIMTQIPKIIQKAIPRLLNALKSIFKGIKKILPDLLKVVMEIVQALFVEIPKFVFSELPSLIQVFVDYLPQLFGAGSQLVVAIANMLPQLLQSIIDAFIAILQDPRAITDLIMALINSFVEIIKALCKNIGPLIEALIPALGTILIEIFKALPNILESVMDSIGEAIMGVGKAILNGFIWALNGLIDGFNAVDFLDWFPDIPHVPYLATGTNAAQRGLAVVGEAGPELVKFNGGEQVINNTNTQKLLSDSGKGNNTFNVTFNNVQDTSAYQMMRQLKQYKRELAFNCII